MSLITHSVVKREKVAYYIFIGVGGGAGSTSHLMAEDESYAPQMSQKLLQELAENLVISGPKP